MKTKQEIKETREYIKDTVQFKIKVAQANEWFERNFKLSDDADEGRHLCERYRAEIKALCDHYVTKVEVYKDNCEYNTDKPRITIDNNNYDWDGWSSAYIGPATPSGIYGAREEEDGKWRPAWLNIYDYEIELSFESFDNPHDAIKRSLTYFAKGTPV